VLATVALIKKGAFWRKLARVVISVELLFVVFVGVMTLIDPSLFPAKTVWSSFGVGYGFTPLALPIIGLLWLRKGSDL
jgi:Na+-transporting NADH:ubiquinone oxidoreductase subunit NqrB